MLEIGSLMRNTNCDVEEISAYDQVVSRFRPSRDPALRERVAAALTAKGLALYRQNRCLDAIATCNQVIVDYERAVEPALAAWAFEARALKEQALERLEGIPASSSEDLRSLLLRRPAAAKWR